MRFSVSSYFLRVDTVEFVTVMDCFFFGHKLALKLQNNFVKPVGVQNVEK